MHIIYLKIGLIIENYFNRDSILFIFKSQRGDWKIRTPVRYRGMHHCLQGKTGLKKIILIVAIQTIRCTFLTFYFKN